MPNTPGGLPYPAASDPVAQGAAAIQALASAVDGLYTIAEVILAATNQSLEVAGLTAKYQKIIVDAALVPQGANGTVYPIMLLPKPVQGGVYMGHATGQGGTNGRGVGGYQGQTEIGLSSMTYHGVEAAGTHRWFGLIEIPYYWRAQRHGISYRTLGKCDYSGNMGNDLNHLIGTAYESANAVAAITGLQLYTSQAAGFGPGSRLTVYGAGKLAPT